MRHILIAESVEHGHQHIRDMDPFFFRIFNISNNKAFVLTHYGSQPHIIFQLSMLNWNMIVKNLRSSFHERTIIYPYYS